MALVKDVEKEYSASFTQLILERRNVTDAVKGLFDKSDELNREIQANVQERVSGSSRKRWTMSPRTRPLSVGLDRTEQ